MADQLERLRPDIICLQEALQTDDKRLDTTGFLADALNLNVSFAPSRWKPRTIAGEEHTCYSGLAILSSHHIAHQRIDRMVVVPKDPDRIALTAQIEIGGEQVLITNLHLTHLKQADDMRFLQLKSAINTLKYKAHSLPWFCCGDFNFSMEHHHLSILQDETKIRIEDCFLEGAGELPGFTFVSTEHPSISKRIDYILNLSQNKKKIIQYDGSRVVLNREGSNGVLPSDHFGVMADIKVLGC